MFSLSIRNASEKSLLTVNGLDLEGKSSLDINPDQFWDLLSFLASNDNLVVSKGGKELDDDEKENFKESFTSAKNNMDSRLQNMDETSTEYHDLNQKRADLKAKFIKYVKSDRLYKEVSAQSKEEPKEESSESFDEGQVGFHEVKVESEGKESFVDKAKRSLGVGANKQN